MPAQAPYVPAPHLIATSHLSAAQLRDYFEDFRHTLRFVAAAPELVFERLVANLSEAFRAASKQEHETIVDSHQPCRIPANDSGIAQTLSTAQTPLLSEVGCTTEPMNSNDIILVPGVVSAFTQDTVQLILPYRDASEAIMATVVGRNPRVGRFCTGLPKTAVPIYFEPPYAVAPILAFGLTAFDIHIDCNTEAKTYANNINRNWFHIYLFSSGGFVFDFASCSWLELDPNDTNFQSGRHRTNQENFGSSPPSSPPREITFSHAYSTPPHVLVWLSSLQACSAGHWSIKASASNVTTTGFTLHTTTPINTALVAEWVAYPAGLLGVVSGTFSTSDNELGPCEGKTVFRSGAFQTPPRVFFAISELTSTPETDMALTVSTANITADGMTWKFDTLQGNGGYHASASYIALT